MQLSNKKALKHMIDFVHLSLMYRKDRDISSCSYCKKRNMSHTARKFFLSFWDLPIECKSCLMFRRVGVLCLLVLVCERNASNIFEQGDVPGHAVYVRGHLNSEENALRFRVEQSCCHSRTGVRNTRELNDGK